MNFFKSLKKIVRMVTRVVQRIVNAVAPNSAVAEAVNETAESVEEWVETTDGGDQGSSSQGGGGDAKPSAPVLTPAQRRLLLLDAMAEKMNVGSSSRRGGNLQQRGNMGPKQGQRGPERILYRDDAPTAYRLQHMDPASRKMYFSMHHLNKGNTGKTSQQFLSNSYEENIDSHDRLLVEQMRHESRHRTNNRNQGGLVGNPGWRENASPIPVYFGNNVMAGFDAGTGGGGPSASFPFQKTLTWEDITLGAQHILDTAPEYFRNLDNLSSRPDLLIEAYAKGELALGPIDLVAISLIGSTGFYRASGGMFAIGDGFVDAVQDHDPNAVGRIAGGITDLGRWFVGNKLGGNASKNIQESGLPIPGVVADYLGSLSYETAYSLLLTYPQFNDGQKEYITIDGAWTEKAVNDTLPKVSQYLDDWGDDLKMRLGDWSDDLSKRMGDWGDDLSMRMSYALEDWNGRPYIPKPAQQRWGQDNAPLDAVTRQSLMEELKTTRALFEYSQNSSVTATLGPLMPMDSQMASIRRTEEKIRALEAQLGLPLTPYQYPDWTPPS